MDSVYDIAGAAKRVEEVALDRYNSPHSGVQMSRMHGVAARYEVASVDGSKRLIYKKESSNEPLEEVIAMLQGVICKHDLPPFTEKLGKNSSHARYLRQSVTVTGLNSKTFNKTVSAMAEIHATLGRFVGKDNVEACGIITSYNNMPALEASNRYFSMRKRNSPDSQEVPLTIDIDPHGYLAQARSSTLYHGEENQVSYFIREGENDYEYKYPIASPIIFNVGDVVELQVSFAMVPLKEGRFKSLLTLRGITLIDGGFTQDAATLRLTSLASNSEPSGSSTGGRVSMKRTIGYHGEEMSVTRAKMGRMEISKDDEQEEGEIEEEGMVVGEINALD